VPWIEKTLAQHAEEWKCLGVTIPQY
jgi:hypothetical protein